MNNDIIPSPRVNIFQKAWHFLKECYDTAVLENKIASLLPTGTNAPDLFHRLNNISRRVQCAHNSSHALEFMLDMLRAPRGIPGCFVEAGCFKGGSTAKFSVIAQLLSRELVVFDSFEGLPMNQEEHDRSLLGHSIKGWFTQGAFYGSLDEVKQNIAEYGEISVCTFVKGYFDDTMPSFNRPILAGFLDVDLAASTKSCLKYLYPLLVEGGGLCSQDGDFPLVKAVFSDESFWKNEVNAEKSPIITGLGRKITRIRKEPMQTT